MTDASAARFSSGSAAAITRRWHSVLGRPTNQSARTESHVTPPDDDDAVPSSGLFTRTAATAHSAGGLSFIDIRGGWENFTQHARQITNAAKDCMPYLSMCCGGTNTLDAVAGTGAALRETDMPLAELQTSELSAGAQQIAQIHTCVSQWAHDAQKNVNVHNDEWTSLKESEESIALAQRPTDHANRMESALKTARWHADSLTQCEHDIAQIQQNVGGATPADEDIARCRKLMEKAAVADKLCVAAIQIVSSTSDERKEVTPSEVLLPVAATVAPARLVLQVGVTSA